MAEIKVTSATLTQKRGELEQLNGQLTSLRGEYETSGGSMLAKWEGDAKTAFKATFDQNMQKIDTFTKAVQNYTTALQEIITQYETTEGQNASIASQR